MLWTGRALSGLAALFLLMDGTMKLFKPSFVLEATERLGFPISALVGIGTILILCTILYVIPRTSVLGAALLTGYLGGAVATHVHARSTWFETLFPVMMGMMVWAGLVLRNSRLRQLMPFVD
jgi:hypothetical protein